MIYIGYLIIVFSLVYASITDIKTKTIKIWLFPLALILSLPFFIYVGPINSYFVVARLLAISFALPTFFIFAKYFGGGGGDIIMTVCVGAALGSQIFFAGLIFSFFATLIILPIQIIICKLKGKPIPRFFPYAPFFTIGIIFGIFFH